MQLLWIFLVLTLPLFSRQTQALSQLVYEIRCPETDRAHFRNVLEKIGEYLALDVLEELETEETDIQTVTGATAQHHLIRETPVLVTILRAGLPLNTGIMKVFPDADVGFLAMSRNEKTLKSLTEYVAFPTIQGRDVIISDTMLATGGSLLDAIQFVEKQGPRRIFIIAAIASKPGIDRILKARPNVKIFAAAVDDALNERGFIIPGLGDAGDRSFGRKTISSSSALER